MKIFTLSLMISMAGAGTSLFAYSFNPFGTSTGEKVLAINPFFYFNPLSPLAISEDTVLAYGLTSNMDIYVDIFSFALAPTTGYSGSWIMPRYDLGGNNIIAAQVFFGTAAGVTISPQYHFFYEDPLLGFEANLNLYLPLSNLSNPTIALFAAPVYKVVKDVVHLYVEIDPSYTVGGNFGLNVVPGAWLGLPGTPFQISLAVPLTGVTGSAMTVGFTGWLWYTMKL